jgi:GTPase SAR1 family protein
MSGEDALNNAVHRMQELIKSNPVKQLQGANEAKTRLLIIDEVLSLLGWSKNEYEPEQATSTRSYTDYRLTIEGQPRLIVEAKRIGVVNPLPKSIQRPEYFNSFLYNNYESEMTMLLKQCQDYCVQCGVPYALATTGEVWIILIGFKHGIEWGKLKSFVFHSLDDIFQRFGSFYGLVSREAIKNNSLDEKFGSMVLIKPSTAIRPREYVDQPPDIKPPPERQTIQAFFDQFMGDITRPDQTTLLKHCYVDNYELNEFSRDLQRILHYDAALDESELPIDQLDEHKLNKALEYQFGTSKPKTILLVGNVGAGKSTFVHKFVRYTDRPNQTICPIIDLINHATKDIIPNREEEQYLAKLILENLAREFQETIDPYSPDILKGCFEVEVGRFKKQRKNLVEQDLQKYFLLEEEHIFELSKDTYKHLVGYIKYARKKRYRVWIIFDNVDRGSNSYQKFIYSFAHQIAYDANCVTIITLRQDTFLEAQGAGFLDVRSSDIVFQITPPEFRRVVSKRRKYVDWLIENNQIPKPLKSDSRLICLLNWHINRLVLDESDAIRLLVTSFSLNNIRYGLVMLKDYYTSYHSTFHELYKNYQSEVDFDIQSELDYKQEYSRFIQAMMLGNSWTYQEDKLDKLDKLYIFNIFSVDPQEKISHFLMLRILAYLSLERNSASSRISIKYDGMCNDFISLGYQRHHINNATRKLLYAGLVLSPDLPASPVTEAKVEVPDPFPQDMKVALSARGHYYIRRVAPLTSHPYYQMRVGEDTVWYNEELAQRYTTFLQESINAQMTYDPEDSLQATDAREIFMNYLRKALFEENQNSNFYNASRDWAQKVDDIVERSVFGEKITKSNYIPENDAISDLDRIVVDHKKLPILPQKIDQKHTSSEIDVKQLTLFTDDVDYRSADYDGATQEALKSLGQMPKGVKLQKSEYIVRVLWALEIAFQAGLGPLRASDIARIITNYGKEPVTASNVAHFFQKQRSSGEYTYLWKEEPKRYYTISSSGRDILSSLLKTEQQEEYNSISHP